MPEIALWKDKATKTLDPELFSRMAEDLAQKLAGDIRVNRKFNKRSQIRKFYDEVLSLDSEARVKSNPMNDILPRLHMLIAKAAYARGRDLVSDNFVNFIRSAIRQVEDPDDLKVFTNFFEALMGYYRLHGPAN